MRNCWYWSAKLNLFNSLRKGHTASKRSSQTFLVRDHALDADRDVLHIVPSSLLQRRKEVATNHTEGVAMMMRRRRMILLVKEKSRTADQCNWTRHSRMPPVRAPVTLVPAFTHAAGTHTGTHFPHQGYHDVIHDHWRRLVNPIRSSGSKCEAAGQIQYEASTVHISPLLRNFTESYHPYHFRSTS